MAKKGLPEPTNSIQSRLGNLDGKLNGNSNSFEKVNGHVHSKQLNGKSSPTFDTESMLEKGSVKTRLGSSYKKSKNKKKNWERIDGKVNGVDTVLDAKPNLDDLKDIKIRVKNKDVLKTRNDTSRPENKPKPVDNHKTSTEDQAKKNARLAKFGVPDGESKAAMKIDSTAENFQSLTIKKDVILKKVS